MSLSPAFRRALAGVAASIAFVTGAPVAQAQAPAAQNPQRAMFAATLNEVCIPFSNTARRQHRYDEPLGLLADRIKSFSGWAEIEAGMKASGQAFEGLCPSTSSPPPVAPMPAIRGFAINILDPETGRGVDPALLTQAIKGGHLDIIADRTILIGSTLATESVSEPLAEPDRDFDTLALLTTVKMAHAQATVITLAVERAVKDGKGEELKKLYEGSPTRIALLSDYHAVAIAAQKQNRDISTAERHAFRDKVAGMMLNDPGMRMNVVKMMIQAAAQDHLNKLVSDIEAGKPFTPIERKAYDADHVKAKLSRFPGALADHADVKNYKEFWQQQRAAGQDPLALGEEYLEGLLKELKDNEDAFRQELKNSNGKKPQLQLTPLQ